MKKNFCATVILFTILLTAWNPLYGQLSWVHSFGDAGTDVGATLELDAAGYVYVAGTFAGTIDFDPSADTAILATQSTSHIANYIAKYTSGGQLVWANHLEGVASGRATITEMLVDPAGNIYCTGRFRGTVDFDPSAGVHQLVSAGSEDIFIGKWNTNGELAWAVRMGNADSDEGIAMEFDGAGFLYIGGSFYSQVDFDPGPATRNLNGTNKDVFVLKLDTSGAYCWAKDFGGRSGDDLGGLTVDVSGNVYTAGSFSDTVDFDPGAGVHKIFGPVTSNFISKLDSSGNFVWAHMFAPSRSVFTDALEVDAAQNFYVGGRYYGVADFGMNGATQILSAPNNWDAFIMKISPAGDQLWVKDFKGAGADGFNDILFDDDGNLYGSGSFNNTFDFDPGLGVDTHTVAGVAAFVLQLDSIGDLQWVKIFGNTVTSALAQMRKIRLDAAGDMYGVGYFKNMIDFEPSTTFHNLTATGTSEDAFILKLSAITPLVVTPGIPTHESCSGLNNGEASVFASGGLPPYTYTWSSGDTVSAVTDLAPGMHIVTVRDAAGSLVADTFVIDPGYDINTGNIVGDDTADVSQLQVYTITAGFAYTWSVTNGTITAGQGTNSVEVDWNKGAPGTIFVMVTDQGCSETVELTVILYDPTAIEEISLNQFELYPNPTSENVTLKLKGALQPPSDVTLLLYDAVGREILQQEVKTGKLQQGIEIDLSAFEAGVFFISLKTASEVRVMKVVKA